MAAWNQVDSGVLRAGRRVVGSHVTVLNGNYIFDLPQLGDVVGAGLYCIAESVAIVTLGTQSRTCQITAQRVYPSTLFLTEIGKYAGYQFSVYTPNYRPLEGLQWRLWRFF